MSPSHFAILFIIVISLVPLHGSGNTQHHNANKPAPNAQAVDASKSAGDKTHSFDANKAAANAQAVDATKSGSEYFNHHIANKELTKRKKNTNIKRISSSHFVMIL
ncbi:maternally expressed family protein [Arabidopsis thaliana]|uniref:Maternally expressed family protein n=1 Tax=Arabidopsis thaliana TaxID=3702 RepID=A0A1P8B0F6_ARATH|nr:maternally expressed family protein [Arabidopsis thaliana]ANM62389.1 maternally expressed family protein [Arabidopsis thaliana]|eukprot:NP_001324549.1 maternally expressed family protein [Arabidopsis thaliana]